jgi:hypothetical protein
MSVDELIHKTEDDEFYINMADSWNDEEREALAYYDRLIVILMTLKKLGIHQIEDKDVAVLKAEVERLNKPTSQITAQEMAAIVNIVKK